VRLFLRLNADLNERLRALLRYQGELSRYIDEALTETDLDGVGLVASRPGKRTPGLTAVISTRANSALRSVARQCQRRLKIPQIAGRKFLSPG